MIKLDLYLTVLRLRIRLIIERLARTVSARLINAIWDPSPKSGDSCRSSRNWGLTSMFLSSTLEFSDVAIKRQTKAARCSYIPSLDLPLSTSFFYLTLPPHPHPQFDRFGVNHVAHFLLTLLLLDVMNEDARIISLSSAAHLNGMPLALCPPPKL